MTTQTAASLERVEVPVSDGTVMAVHVAWPAKKIADVPGIIVGQDAFGVTSFLRDVGVRLAEFGFVAALPEPYHRSGDNMVCPYDDRKMTTCKPLQDAMTPDGTIADGNAVFDWLTTKAGVAEDHVGATHRRLRAGISLYGRIPPAIHRYATQQHGEILMMWGGRDHGIPPENTTAPSATSSRPAVRSTRKSSFRRRRTRSSVTSVLGRTMRTPRGRHGL